MRRAILATVGTVAGLVAVLDYKASNTVKSSNLQVSAPAGATTTVPSSSATTVAPGSSSPTTAAAASGKFTGQDVVYQYGDIQVELVFNGSKITNINIPQESATDPRSQSINSQAVPILTQEALAAQGLNINVVSGATYTSNAFAQAMQSALTKAGR